MEVVFHGTRGSITSVPTISDLEYLKSSGDFKEYYYGGDTTCVEIFHKEHSLVVDAGSGIRRVNFQGKAEHHVLFTHFHWDHITGLNFFIPMFLQGHEVHLYSAHDAMEESIKILFNGINFPIAFNQLGSRVIFHKLELYKEHNINSFMVTPYKLDHPGRSYGYRIKSEDGKVIGTAFDTEHIRMSSSELENDINLYKNLDLLIFDSQYDLIEIVHEKMNWGHAAPSIAIDVALKNNVKNLALLHHDPYLSHEKLKEKKAWVSEYYESQIKQTDARTNVCFVKDNEKISLS